VLPYQTKLYDGEHTALDKFNYLNRDNLEYIENEFKNYLSDPASIEPEWKHFFQGIEFAKNFDSDGSTDISSKEIDVYNLIRYYQDYGHLKAQLDPLNLSKPRGEDFSLERFNLSDGDLTQSFQVGSVIGLPNATLGEMLTKLEKLYCGTMGVQVSGCEPAVRKWFHDELESGSPEFELSSDDQKNVFKSLTKTETLEKFIHTRYVGTKRFSIEGGDALMPMLEHCVEVGTKNKIKELVIGMAHRGRINVLANFMNKALDITFSDFDGTVIDNTGFDGDVKYHMGYSADKKTEHGDCHISLAFNPSHLECVSPVACGMTRAKQRLHGDTEKREKVMPVLIHGDAAFIGQGVVSETLQLSQLEGYTVGGSLHIIVNNQVGFTTSPEDSRSTRYSSDIAKSIKAPVILVNGDDVESCLRAINIAVRFRQQFKQDIVIDLICYRRYGHNEGDEPSFTQPEMYKVIKKHPTLNTIYSNKLIEEDVLTEAESKSFYQEKMDNLQDILDEVRKNPAELKPSVFQGNWKGLRHGNEEDILSPADTTVKMKDLLAAAKPLTEVPGEFNINSKVKRLIGNRGKMVTESKIDWGMAELMAYATIRQQGIPVRITGQDCKRGTFTHRHAVYFDQETGAEYCPLQTIKPEEGEFCVYNSSLSEMAVLGYEYGNSISDPTFLTIWEAQFGDFANGAQIIIDQFLTSGEQKWSRHTGLTLLLPHGYAGQGPEHSSARLERFLQMSAQANMQVCNITTPANMFHALRRQVMRDFRKPLVVMSPKSLLRHAKVKSTLEEMASGTFKEILSDPKSTKPEEVKKLVLCSGKIYYELDEHREENNIGGSTAILRLEQIFPLARTQLASYLNGFKNLKRIVWCQEEPKNMGAYSHIAPEISELCSELGIKIYIEYAGRSRRASPATGSPRTHKEEQAKLIAECFN